MTESVYYVNKNTQPNGDHEVHKHSCNYKPKDDNCILLGKFHTCHPAVREAKKHYSKSDGCYYCSKECHTK